VNGLKPYYTKITKNPQKGWNVSKLESNKSKEIDLRN
jgi:hypothetical protein